MDLLFNHQKLQIPFEFYQFWFPSFQKLIGVHVLIFDAPILHQTLLGFKSDALLIFGVFAVVVNLVVTSVSVFRLKFDEFVWRMLSLNGGISLCIIQTTVLPHYLAALVVFCICIFVAIFAVSMNEKH